MGNEQRMQKQPGQAMDADAPSRGLVFYCDRKKGWMWAVPKRVEMVSLSGFRLF